MDVQLLFSPGCPGWPVAHERLQQALLRVGSDAEVVLVEVATAQDAARLPFRGSPTVLVDGTDPFADGEAPEGLSCRVFRTPEGLRGSPTVEQLVAALQHDG